MQQSVFDCSKPEEAKTVAGGLPISKSKRAAAASRRPLRLSLRGPIPMVVPVAEAPGFGCFEFVARFAEMLERRGSSDGRCGGVRLMDGWFDGRPTRLMGLAF